LYPEEIIKFVSSITNSPEFRPSWIFASNSFFGLSYFCLKQAIYCLERAGLSPQILEWMEVFGKHRKLMLENNSAL
jgi:hypothetical protein